MSNPVCISPLKFYDSPAKQNHRKSYAYNHITPIITKTGWIPPFQLVIPEWLYGLGNRMTLARIFDAKTGRTVIGNLNSALRDSGYSARRIDF